jgi:hypothetical protein
MLRRCKAVTCLTCIVVAIAGAPATAGAQSVDAAAAYLSLVLTSAGALPPHLGASSIPTQFSGHEITVRYGQRQGSISSRNVGVGIEFGLGEERLGGTLGVAGCSECDDAIMVGVDVSMSLSGPPTVQRGATLSTRLAGSSSLGVPLNGDFVVIATTVGLPLLFSTSVTSGTAGPRLAIYAIPSIAHGALTCNDDCSASGFLFALGAAAGVLRAGRFDATVGVNKVFIENGETLVGVSASWRLAP